MRVLRIAPLVGALLLGGCTEVTGPDPSDRARMQVSALVANTAVETIVVEVTAADLESPLVFNLERSGDVASGEVLVPPGEDRTFTARAFDAAGHVTHEGSRTVDVEPGPNPPLRITLLPRSGVQPIEITFGTVSVVVTPSTGELVVGETLQLEVTITGPDGPIADDPTWATADPGVATVDETGLVTAVGGGEVRVVATYGGVAGLAVVEVSGDGGEPGPCAAGLGQEVVDLINAARADAGAGDLLVDLRLVAAAEGHSAYMADTETLSHTGSGGSTFVDRIEAEGYDSPTSGGEVIASGQTTATAVVDAWLASVGHRDILLDDRYDHIGVGYAESLGGTPYWTVDVGGNDTHEGPADGCHPSI